MTQARQEQVSLDSTAFYHCYVRCVRRAYLCGKDRETGENYEHRKQWLVSRIRFLSYVFSIDICAYAVLSNHYHVVLHVDQERAAAWSEDEVVERWLQLYKGSPLVSRWLAARETLSTAELTKVAELIELWRERLCDISWFMRGVNEKIARMANEEENCKGRFWEGRFKSQALLDEAALLSCMTYVDLNPVRAGVADDLNDSDFTSIQQRIYDYCRESQVPANDRLVQARQVQKNLTSDLKFNDLPQAPLMAFDGSSHDEAPRAIPFALQDYFDLVDDTGRVIRADKRGAINPKSQALLKQLGINPEHWLEHIRHFGRRHAHCAGSPVCIQEYANHFALRWRKGMSVSRQVYAA